MTTKMTTTKKPNHIPETTAENMDDTKTTALQTVTENLPMAASIFEDDAGAGLEGADKNSFAIPFITLLQGLSPQLETVEGARPGLFINTITNELYAKVLVVPCAYQRRFLRWAPRSAGGGFKGEYNPADVEMRNVHGMKEINGQYMMDVPDGAEGSAFDADGRSKFDTLADTRNHFVLVQSLEGSWKPALISLSSTQIKSSKRWMARIQCIELRNAAGKAYNPPSFSHIYEISSVKQENAKGKWNGYEINMYKMVDDGELYAKAKAFHANVIAGAVEVQHPDQTINPENMSSDADAGDVNKF